jgi:hypothetical protein
MDVVKKEDLTKEARFLNSMSHDIGAVDDCYRCIHCEVGSWNAWKFICPNAKFCGTCAGLQDLCECNSFEW